MASDDDLRSPAGGPGLSRRAVLRRAGLGLASALVVGTGLVGYRAYDQGVFEVGEGPAYDPWRTWQHGDAHRRLVRAAVLAPSPHNAQAWAFAVSDRHVDVLADVGRRTGALDPFDRELHLGLGAAIENLVLAARAEGWAPTVELLPTGDPTHVARVALSPAPPRVLPLHEQIPRRRTDRNPYQVDQTVERAARESMAALALPGVRVIWVADRRERLELGDLIVDATRQIVEDPAQLESDHVWFRHSWDEVQRRRDGITLDAAGLPALVTTVAKLLPAQSAAGLGEAWLESTASRHTATAAAYGILAVDDAADVPSRIRAGRTLQRIHLWATGTGIALHHMNQVTERIDREVVLGRPATFAAAMERFVAGGRQAVCTFRIGLPTRRPHLSPRRPVEEVVR